MFILMISIIIVLVIVVFAVQNAAIVPVQFLGWSTDLPLVLVIFCSVFAGALLMFCLALWRELKHQISKRPKLELKKNLPFGKDSQNAGAPKPTAAANSTQTVEQKSETNQPQ